LSQDKPTLLTLQERLNSIDIEKAVEEYRLTWTKHGTEGALLHIRWNQKEEDWEDFKVLNPHILRDVECEESVVFFDHLHGELGISAVDGADEANIPAAPLWRIERSLILECEDCCAHKPSFLIHENTYYDDYGDSETHYWCIKCESDRRENGTVVGGVPWETGEKAPRAIDDPIQDYLDRVPDPADNEDVDD